MKKVLISMLAAAMAAPAVAEELPLDEPVAAVEAAEKVPSYDEDYNLKYVDPATAAEDAGKASKPWWRGWQIGAGVPLLPFSYNGFIGYANKKAEGFWGKRFGARLDFQIPSAMKANATLVRNDKNEYDINADMKVLFLSQKFDKISDTGRVDFVFDGTHELMLDNAKANLTIKNQNVGGLIDFYPFGNTWFLGGIRLSGGYYTGKMDIGMSATLPENNFSYDIGLGDKINVKMPGGSKIAANMAWKYSGPYAGVGFDLGFFWGIKMYMDAGVVFAKPPKLSAPTDTRGSSNVDLPTVLACYETGGNCGNNMQWNLNEKPNVDALVKDVLSELVNAKVNEVGNNIPTGVKDAIADRLGVPRDQLNGANFGGLANDILGYLNNEAPAGWLGDMLAAGGTDAQAVKNALNDVRAEWNDLNSGADPNSLRSELDDIWNDYAKGINDMNDSLKDMRFMPVVKLGLMYRF